MDSWLKTAGVNTLKAHLVDDGLEVEQFPAKFGDQILREQMIDVAVFDEQLNIVKVHERLLVKPVER